MSWSYGRRDNQQKRVGKMLTTLWLSWIKIMLLENLSKYLSQLKNYRFQHAKKKIVIGRRDNQQKRVGKCSQHCSWVGLNKCLKYLSQLKITAEHAKKLLLFLNENLIQTIIILVILIFMIETLKIS